MSIIQRKKLILIAALGLLVAMWLSFSLRDDDSTLLVLSRYVGRRTGLSPDRNVYEVLRTMQTYERRGRYDDAIATGVDWTNKHAIDGSNDRVFVAVAVVFLEEAKQNPQRADDYVSQAILYRDKALPIASDASLGWYSVGTLRDMALISESAGDLSYTQRCVQYRNAVKLLERVLDELQQKQAEISRRTPNTEDQFGVSRDTVEHISEQTKATIARVSGKKQNAACE